MNHPSVITTAIPAVCNSCHQVFPGFTVALSQESLLRLSGNTVGPCPNCGGMGKMVDGTFAIVGDAVRKIAEYSSSDFTRLREILLEARTKHSSVTTVAESMQDVPALEQLAKWLITMFKPKSAGDFYAFVAVLLSLIPMLKPDAPTQPTVQPQPMVQQLSEEQIVNLTVKAMAAALEQKQPMAKPSSTSTKIKQGRNEACACGSGKKHKRCCL